MPEKVLRAVLACCFFAVIAYAQRPVLRQGTVANLPAASANTGITVFVTDGINVTDCTNGGGGFTVPCKSNGTAWLGQSIGIGNPPYVQSFTSQTSVVLTHNLATTNVVIACYDAGNRQLAPGSVLITDSNDITVGFAAVESGRCVVNGGIGPAGPAGAGGTAPFSQSFTAQTSLTITHNLGTINVLVGCYDSSNNQIAPGRVSVVDNNNVAVSFSSAETGRCVVNGGVGPQGAIGPAGSGSASAVQTIGYSVAPSVNLSSGNYITITLTGNAAPTFSNIVTATTYHFQICQDATGGHSWTWPNAVHGGIAVGTTANTCSMQDLSAWSNASLYGVGTGLINQ